MRACVIFNPAAKGEKSRRFFANLDSIAAQCKLKRTAGPGDATRLATEAVQQGFDTIIAAGGDGTLNEVVNGLGVIGEELSRVRLGFLPLGTVNVFARELGIPSRPEEAWKIILRGREKTIDLPYFEFRADGEIQRQYFAQMAGAGLDAAAIAAVSWELKKRIGPLAYVVAGLKALHAPRPRLTVTSANGSATGELVLFGNGRFYGGEFQLHPRAAMDDGLIDACVLARTNWLTLLRCGPSLLLRNRVPESLVTRLQAREFSITADSPARFEVDGELAGELPAKVSVRTRALRVIVGADSR
ncbi:MAG: diacylglycerol kinase family lipid kinase [Verrucomicrobia bacterium]|nr:MAG: diacylglycerol kinase family lipid kinase [Verrucomicrobiota bacterium]